MTSQAQHTDVGAYLLGVLDAEDAARFEEHLAACTQCAARLDELLPVAHLLGEVAPPGTPDAEALVARPEPELLDRLLAKVAADRSRRRRRRLVLVAVAAALIVTGPVAAVLAGRDDGGAAKPPTAEQAFDQGAKFHQTDSVTKADATVSLSPEAWGTRVALRLSGVQGPLTCELVAIGTDGEEQPVSSWSVPAAGYGAPDGGGGTTASKPLLTRGGIAMSRKEIDRFEVRTLDGRHLVTVKV